MTNGETVVLVDTVGFIQRLLHELIAAFRHFAGSERGNLLLHVIDASDPNYRDNIGHVEACCNLWRGGDSRCKPV
ncbi:MAG: hypothetical protein U1F68_13360 [Gammaproteobacteria bacterium]